MNKKLRLIKADAYKDLYTIDDFYYMCEMNQDPYFTYRGCDYLIVSIREDEVAKFYLFDALEFETVIDAKPLVTTNTLDELFYGELIDGKSVPELFKEDDFQMFEYLGVEG